MLRQLIIFGVCAGVSASFPVLYEAYQRDRASVVSVEAPTAENGNAGVQTVSTPSRSGELTGRRVSLERDDNGHFGGDFKLNGRKVTAMVDTGATAVAINLSTARRVGLDVKQSDLTASVNTANGSARAAMAIIGRLDIGRISIENVEAIVMEDRALSGTLIGMTFLNRLRKVEVDDGTMVLVQ